MLTPKHKQKKNMIWEIIHIFLLLNKIICLWIGVGDFICWHIFWSLFYCYCIYCSQILFEEKDNIILWYLDPTNISHFCEGLRNKYKKKNEQHQEGKIEDYWKRARKKSNCLKDELKLNPFHHNLEQSIYFICEAFKETRRWQEKLICSSDINKRAFNFLF